VVELSNALGDTDLRLPAEHALELAHVTDVDALIAGPPVVVTQWDLASHTLLEQSDEIDERQELARSAADGECLALDLVGRRDRRLVGPHEIVHVEHVAHLLAVAVDGNRAAQARGDREPGDPTLILNAELPRAIDARLAERRRGDPIDPREIERVLVRGPLRAAIRREEVQRLFLVD